MAKQYDYSDEYDVFISYRREGGQMMAVILHDRLKAEGYRVFLDVESLRSGKFNKKLLTVIEKCTDFVIILSPDSLDRCQNEGDWVRTEIVHALNNDKNVIPIILNGFKWPSNLPEDIEELHNHNGIKHNDIEYLDAVIRRLCDDFLHSEPRSNNTGRHKPGKQTKQKQPLHNKTKGLAIGAVSLVLVAALVFGGIMLWGNRDTADDPAVLGNGSLSNTQQPDADPSQAPDDLSNSPAAETPFQSAESTPPSSANTQDETAVSAIVDPVFEVTHAPLTNDDYYTVDYTTPYRPGLITQEGEWIYFNLNNKLYRAKANGDDFEELSANFPRDVWVKDGKLYFINMSRNYSIYSMNVDGSDREVFCDDYEINVVPIVSNDGIHFYVQLPRHFDRGDGTYGGGGNVIIDWQQNVQTQFDDVSLFLGTHYCQFDGYIYFSHEYESRELFKFRPGEEPVRVSDDHAYNIQTMNGKIYYVNFDDSFSLYSINPDGTDRRKIVSKTLNYMVSNGVIFFSTNDKSDSPISSANEIYRINPETDIKELLFRLPDDYSIYNMHLLGNWIYLHVTGSDNTSLNEVEFICRLKTDGSAFEVIISRVD